MCVRNFVGFLLALYVACDLAATFVTTKQLGDVFVVSSAGLQFGEYLYHCFYVVANADFASMIFKCYIRAVLARIQHHTKQLGDHVFVGSSTGVQLWSISLPLPIASLFLCIFS